MAKAKLTKEETFPEVSEDVVKFFKERLEKFSMPLDFKFQFQGNLKQKTLIKLSKITDHFSVLLKKDILVHINEDYFESFETEDDKINEILFDQCIDLISYNMDTGVVKINKENFTATEGIIEKYGYDGVQRAKEVERLFGEQKDDSEN